MSISHIRDDRYRNTCTRLPITESRPVVGYWLTLEDQYPKEGDTKDGSDDYHAPGREFLIFIHTYLQ
jgi:hypothetical protein